MAGLTLAPFLVVLAPRVNRDPGLRARVLEHELVHVEQMRRYGWLRFLFAYSTARGRTELEAEAYGRVNVRYLAEMVGFERAVQHCVSILSRRGLYFPRWLFWQKPLPAAEVERLIRQWAAEAAFA